MDPLRILDERDPYMQAVNHALIAAAERLRQQHQDELATRVVNQLSEAMGA